MKQLLLAAFALALVPSLSLADAAAPAAAPAVDSMAPPVCKKPSMHTKMMQADDDAETNDKIEAYSTCMKAYIDAQSELANRHNKAANDAIIQLNDFTKQANDYILQNQQK